MANHKPIFTMTARRSRKLPAPQPQKMQRVLAAFGRLTPADRRRFVNAVVSDQGGTNPKLGNPSRNSRGASQRPPTSQFTNPSPDETDYFRTPRAGRAAYNNEPDKSITPARVTLSVRMRNNPIKGLTFDRLTGYLDQWRLGFFRLAGMAWDTMERRDYQLQIVRPKRLKSVARHGYDVLTVENVPQGMEQLAAAQQQFLKTFYDNLTATKALNPDEQGDISLLIRDMMDAVGKYYSVHEIIWQPDFDGLGNLTAKFIHCPVWWFEGTRGKLRFLPSEFQIYGNEMADGEWLVTCGDGIMEACSVIYLLKYLPMKSWIAFLDKFAMPGIHGKTDAPKGSEEWNNFVEAIQEFGEEWATVTNRSGEINLIEAKATGDAGYKDIIALMDRAITQLWRGADLGTTSSQDGTGASLQADESEILETDDAVIIESTLKTKVSRYALAWKFGENTPQLAYLKLRTTPKQNVTQDVQVDQFLLGAGAPLGVKATLERYGRPVPDDDEALLEKAMPAGLPGRPPAQGDPAFANETTEQDIAATLREMLLPLLKRLEAIARIDDPAIQQHMLEKLLNDFPSIAAAIQADNSLANKLSPVLGRQLVAGLNAKNESKP